MNAAEILERIRRLRVLVLGDICLDRWCWYDPALALPSAETGIPRTAVVRSVTTPGAGGTVANNLVALGVENVSVLSVIGDDGSAWELRRAMVARNISPELLISTPELNTFTYTKLINAGSDTEDRPRVDFINSCDLPLPTEEQVLRTLESKWPEFDVVIVADQAETETGGVVTAAVRQRIIELAADGGKVVWVDSRRRPELFQHVVLKPNRLEAEEACRRKFDAVDLHRLAAECRLKSLIVTHGDRGALVIAEGREQWVPGRRVEPVDICGAGDSFSAGAACTLAVTGSSVEAAAFGNLVASITVTKKGTGTASPSEVLAAT